MSYPRICSECGYTLNCTMGGHCPHCGAMVGFGLPPILIPPRPPYPGPRQPYPVPVGPTLPFPSVF